MSSTLAEATYEIIKERMAYMPENYLRSGIIANGTASASDPQHVFNQNKINQPITMWKLQKETKEFYTPIPISVKICRDEDLFFTENENLAVYGTGNTLEDALQDLCLHIIHFFEYYKKLDISKITGDALRLKKLYQNLLVAE